MQKSIVGQIRDSGTYTRDKPRKLNGGWNLSDVLRDITWEIADDRGWSLNELAKQIGYNPSSITRFLNGDRGEDMDLRLEFLSCLCAYLGESPIELFARHPVFRKKNVKIYDRVTTALEAHEARQLLPLLEEASFLGVTDLALNSVHVTVETAKRSGLAANGRGRPG